MKNEGFKPPIYGLLPLKMKVLGSHGSFYFTKPIVQRLKPKAALISGSIGLVFQLLGGYLSFTSHPFMVALREATPD